jgi:hypothetical protein
MRPVSDQLIRGTIVALAFAAAAIFGPALVDYVNYVNACNKSWVFCSMSFAQYQTVTQYLGKDKPMMA